MSRRECWAILWSSSYLKITSSPSCKNQLRLNVQIMLFYCRLLSYLLFNLIVIHAYKWKMYIAASRSHKDTLISDLFSLGMVEQPKIEGKTDSNVSKWNFRLKKACTENKPVAALVDGNFSRGCFSILPLCGVSIHHPEKKPKSFMKNAVYYTLHREEVKRCLKAFEYVSKKDLLKN